MYDAVLMWFRSWPPVEAPPDYAPHDDAGFEALATGTYIGHVVALFLTGPYWVAITLRTDGGQLELAQYRVSLLPTPDSARPTVRTSDTRLIPLNEMVRKARQRYSEELARLAVKDPEALARRVGDGSDITDEVVAAFTSWRDAAAEFLERPQRSRMGRPSLTEAELLGTAKAYVAAEQSGHDPIRAVMKKARVEKSSAYRRVKQARAHIEFLRSQSTDDKEA